MDRELNSANIMESSFFNAHHMHPCSITLDIARNSYLHHHCIGTPAKTAYQPFLGTVKDVLHVGQNKLTDFTQEVTLNT